MLLSLRGWGPEHFARATPALLSGARWALWAEKAAVLLANADHNKDIDVRGMEPRRQAELLRLRIAAAENAATIRSLMFPEDD